MSKVLVVDDDVGITILLQRIISKKGHQILIARNGLEGLTLAQNELPDLIFTDLRMPDLGGLELAAYVKADPALAQIPIVILSGTAYLMDLEATEADAILTKPFDLKAVYALLDRFLGTSENLSPDEALKWGRQTTASASDTHPAYPSIPEQSTGGEYTSS